jgi:hypothetical protein
MIQTRNTITLNDIHTILEAHTQSRGWLDRNLFREHPTIAAMRSQYEHLKLLGRREEQALSERDLLPFFIPVLRIHADDAAQADAIYTLYELQKLFGLTQTEGAYYNYKTLYANVQSMRHKCIIENSWVRLYQQSASLAEIEIALRKYQKLAGELDPIAVDEICDLAGRGEVKHASCLASGLAALKIVNRLTDENLNFLRQDPIHAEELGKKLALQAANLGDDEQNLYAAIKDDSRPKPEALQWQVLDPRLARRREQAVKRGVVALIISLFCMLMPGIVAPVLGVCLLLATFGALAYVYFRTESGRKLKIERPPQQDDSFYQALQRHCALQEKARAQLVADQESVESNLVLVQSRLSDEEIARAVQAEQLYYTQQQRKRPGGGGHAGAGGGAPAGAIGFEEGDGSRALFHYRASTPATSSAGAQQGQAFAGGWGQTGIVQAVASREGQLHRNSVLPSAPSENQDPPLIDFDSASSHSPHSPEPALTVRVNTQGLNLTPQQLEELAGELAATAAQRVGSQQAPSPASVAVMGQFGNARLAGVVAVQQQQQMEDMEEQSAPTALCK